MDNDRREALDANDTAQRNTPFPFLDGEGQRVDEERRRGERRHWDHKPSFPLVDANGEVVTHNRRRIVDRRIGLRPRRVETGGARLAPPGARLVLTFEGRTQELGAHRPRYTVGRRPECDLHLDSKYVSRDHAILLYRDGGFVLVDQSSNGTSVLTEDGERHTVHGGELVLTGRGIIRFGQIADSSAPEALHFVCEV